MQLVAMALAASLLLVRTVQSCRSGCQKVPVQITLEECGNISVRTTICAGQCFTEDAVYVPKEYPREGQKICNGIWSYEVAAFEGCPPGVTYPVATECKCDPCEQSSTACYPRSTPPCPAK